MSEFARWCSAEATSASGDGCSVTTASQMNTDSSVSLVVPTMVSSGVALNTQSTESISSTTLTTEDHQEGSIGELAYSLPTFSTSASPTFTWGDEMSGPDFVEGVTSAYDEVIHWRKNFFSLPQGNLGKKFTGELASLFRSFGEGTAMECIALKAAMVLPILVLQRSHKSSSNSENRACLLRRLEAWKSGDLVDEGRTLQRRFRQRKKNNQVVMLANRLRGVSTN